MSSVGLPKRRAAAKRVSVVVPYYRRIANLRRMLDALVEQDMPKDEFEVVIGCLEYSTELVQAVASLNGALAVRCVMAGEHWNVARARNLALRQAEAEVLLLLDADMLLPREFLSRLYSTYFARGQRNAVVGQMLNYDEAADVAADDPGAGAEYGSRQLRTNSRLGLGHDVRWTIERNIPWALCWTAVVALPRSALDEYALFFDADFQGWGVEDTEWAYRLHLAGIPIVFADDLWAIHLPHPRDVARNHQDEARNFRRFIAKWPNQDTEIVASFGDVGSNRQYRFIRELTSQMSGSGVELCLVEFRVSGELMLAIGVECTRGDGQVVDSAVKRLWAGADHVRPLPLVGFALPYETGVLARSYLLPAVRTAPEDLKTRIEAEARRVSRQSIEIEAREK